MATRIERLTSQRDALERIVDAQLAAWEAAGAPPTMSIDGESYQWDSWLTSKLEAIEKLNKLIQSAKPFYVRSRHRG